MGDTLISTDGRLLGSYEATKKGLFDIKLLGTIVGNVYVITVVLDFGTDLGSLDW